MRYRLGEITRKTTPTVTVMTALPNTLEYNSSGVLVGTYASGGPIPTKETSSSIVYTKRVRRDSKRSNFCAHTVYSRKMGVPENAPLPEIIGNRLDPPHAGWYSKVYWDYGASYNAHVAAQPIALAALGTYGLTKLQANWMSYAASGFAAVQPDLTALSLPNFLIEIKQMKDLLRDIRPLYEFSTGKLRAQLPVDVKRFRELSKGDKVRSTSRLIAGKRLSYKYGWKPTVGDVSAMLGSVLQLQERLDAFKAGIGKTLSFTKTIENTSIVKSGTFNLGGDIHYKVNWWGSLDGKVQYHAKYQPQALLALGPIDEVVRGFLDSFGVELNPRIIWDAIPFSFVLDNFVQLGNWLEQFKVDALNLPIQIVDSAVSYKETYQVNSTVTINPNGYPTDLTSTTKPAGYFEQRRFYHRMPVDPSVSTYRSLGWKNPSGSQWINLVSLATVLGV